MKMSLFIKVAVLVAVLSLAPCAFPQQTENAGSANSAQSFVASLYSRYGPDGNPAGLLNQNASEAFDPSLIALAKADAAALGPGQVGFFDYDPLCNCQETDVMFPNLKITVEPVDADHATATVTFSDLRQKQITIVLALVNTRDGWRIFNIEDQTGPGRHTDLRTMFNNEIQALSSKRHPK